jgi:archaellum biogenesis ATPase FlaH
MNLERAIFNNLINNETYGRKTIPFLKNDYFHNASERVVFELIDVYVNKYNAFPTKEALLVDLSSRDNISEDQFSECKNIIQEIPDQSDQLSNVDWLIDQTERFCQDKAIYNAIMNSIRIMDDKTGQTAKGSIPQLLSDALAVSFDTSIGHDFIDDADARFEFYHRKEERLPFDLDYLNKITRGGLPRKTLNILLAGTGVGKTLAMCHFAASYLDAGKNVLYITMEMAEEKIAERIDANLLNVPLGELHDLTKDAYDRKVNKLKQKTVGKLIIKEYPTSTAGAGNFRHLLNELKIKKNFIPDVIFIDYLNICMSSRLKQGANVNSYTYIKAIAEELRGLAVEYNVPVISATQTTRCLALDTKVELENGQTIDLAEVKTGDRIRSVDSFVTVNKVYPIEEQDVYEIKLKSGKTVVCSSKHIWPTTTGMQTIESGLSAGHVLFSAT